MQFFPFEPYILWAESPLHASDLQEFYHALQTGVRIKLLKSILGWVGLPPCRVNLVYYNFHSRNIEKKLNFQEEELSVHFPRISHLFLFLFLSTISRNARFGVFFYPGNLDKSFHFQKKIKIRVCLISPHSINHQKRMEDKTGWNAEFLLWCLRALLKFFSHRALAIFAYYSGTIFAFVSPVFFSEKFRATSSNIQQLCSWSYHHYFFSPKTFKNNLRMTNFRVFLPFANTIFHPIFINVVVLASQKN